MTFPIRRAAALLLVALAAPGCTADEKPPLPAEAPAAAPAATDAATADESTDTVLGVAAASADLQTFVALARASGFDATLRDTAQTLTVFAPSDAAFEALGADALTALRADPDALRARLAGHVLPYRLFSGDVDGEQTAGTAGAAELTLAPGPPLSVRRGATTARVATPDLDAGNGVVHVVDAVLAP